jgi:NnrS protein
MVGAVGTMTLAVMTRASLGHTGHPGKPPWGRKPFMRGCDLSACSSMRCVDAGLKRSTFAYCWPWVGSGVWWFRRAVRADAAAAAPHGERDLQTLLTAFVSVPTLLTIFTITASMEMAGRLRGGPGVFGWIRALPWERPMVLAVGLSFMMLGFGGFGERSGVSELVTRYPRKILHNVKGYSTK